MESINSKKKEGLTFGIYPGSGVGFDIGLGVIQGREDNEEKIKLALQDLSNNKLFLVRGYVQYVRGGYLTPGNVERYCND